MPPTRPANQARTSPHQRVSPDRPGSGAYCLEGFRCRGPLKESSRQPVSVPYTLAARRHLWGQLLQKMQQLAREVKLVELLSDVRLSGWALSAVSY